MFSINDILKCSPSIVLICPLNTDGNSPMNPSPLLLELSIALVLFTLGTVWPVVIPWDMVTGEAECPTLWQLSMI